MIRSLFYAGFAAILALSATMAFADDGIARLGALEISGAFARATLPNAPVGGGFLTITNSGAETDRLIAVHSPLADDAQIHEMQMDGDVMKMRHLSDGLEIAPGTSVTLAPGSFHIMFTGLHEAFVEGTSISVTLVFERAGTVEMQFPVLGVAAAQAQ